MTKTIETAITQSDSEMGTLDPSLFRLKTSYGSVLKTIVKSISAVCEFPAIQQFETEDLIKFWGMDPAHSVIHSFRMKPEFFDNCLQLDGDQPAYIPIDTLAEWFRLSEITEPVIELAAGGRTFQCSISAFDQPSEFNQVPFSADDIEEDDQPSTDALDVDYDCYIRVPTATLKQVFKVFPLKKFETVNFLFSEDGVKFSATSDEKGSRGEYKELFIPAAQAIAFQGGASDNMFSNAYLKGIITIEPVSPAVTLYQVHNGPAQFVFDIANHVTKKSFAENTLGEAIYYLANRVPAEDDDNYEDD